MMKKLIAGPLAALIALSPSLSMAKNNRLLFMGGASVPAWVAKPLPNGPSAAVDMNFATAQYFGRQPSQLVVTRLTTESEICNGVMSTFAINQAPITPGCGLWEWEGRTNILQNNTMVGAVAGSPGILPTNWFVGLNGVSQQIVATGTLPNGMPYIDIRLFGTTSGQFFSECFDTVAGAPNFGATYSLSMYLARIASPNIANIGQYGVKMSDGLNQFLTSITPTAALTEYAYNFTKLLAGGNQIQPCFFFNMTGASGQTLDFTMRFALPQFELNPNINASVASAIALASGASGVNGAGVYTINGGTCTTQPTLNVTWAAGALTVNSVANAGVCTVLPTNPAALSYKSGVATGWIGATATNTPTDNAAAAFPTGPILTSGSAASRAANIITASGISHVEAFSLSAIFTPLAPNQTNYPAVVELDNGSSIASSIVLAPGSAAVYISAATAVNLPSVPISLGSVIDYGGSFVSNAYITSFNGLTSNSSVTPGASTLAQTTLRLGSRVSAGACDCLISRASLFVKWLTQSQLNNITSK